MSVMNSYGTIDAEMIIGSKHILTDLLRKEMEFDGVVVSDDGLKINLCFPPEWDKAEMTRELRGAKYHILIENPEQLTQGELLIKVDCIN